MANPFVTRRPKPITSIPHWLRPKLQRDQVMDLHIMHRTNLDVIQSGQAGEALLWDLVHSVLTYVNIAEIRNRGMHLIEPQLALCTQLIDHYRETGRVELTPEQYELAKEGADVMDAFAEFTDAHTAEVATAAALRTTDQWAAEMAAARAGQ